MSLGYTSQIERALRVRRPLLEEHSLDAVRILNGAADGVPGLVIEKLGPALIVQLHEQRLGMGEEAARAIAEKLCQRLGATAVYRKWFVRSRGRVDPRIAEAHKDAEPWLGQAVAPEYAVREHGLQFLVRPYDGFAYGLFLDHRDNRKRVGELSAGRRVLNLFAYTCGFSVAAAVGGAIQVASVDAHKRYLEWGKRNFELNGVDLTAHRFYCSDVFEFYKRARRQGLRYDLIILDPPTFSRQRQPRRVFVLEEELERLCAGAIELLEQDGLLLLATNDRAISRQRLEEAVQNTVGAHRCEICERPSLPIDFAGDPDYSKTVIARLR
ncbi:MAG: class I SAM-dependent rRNA methyltransferase [Phycisphaerae bacterium]